MATVTIIGREGLLGNGSGPSTRKPWSAIGTAAAKLSTVLMVWHERACGRRQLLGLGTGELKDFAASRADAAFESNKPFWRP
jgi:uncharacterized protein YjiS (DUF1127 family)